MCGLVLCVSVVVYTRKSRTQPVQAPQVFQNSTVVFGELIANVQCQVLSHYHQNKDCNIKDHTCEVFNAYIDRNHDKLVNSLCRNIKSHITKANRRLKRIQHRTEAYINQT